MSQFFQIHPDNPQARLVRQAGDIVRAGGVIVYPTDSAYAIGCRIGDKNAVERIRQIRRLDDRHNFTLVCRDLSEIATYARVDNTVYRLLRHHTPGPYTFILKATSEVPRRLMHPKRRTVGLRVPENAVAQALGRVPALKSRNFQKEMDAAHDKLAQLAELLDAPPPPPFHRDR